jgi:hypothetical protein
MKTIFNENFLNHLDKEHPDGLVVENNCEQPHLLGYVEDKKYLMVFPGNKHIPLTGEIKNFSLNVNCHAEKCSNHVIIVIYFRYCREKRCGYRLEYKWDEKHASLKFEAYNKGDTTSILSLENLNSPGTIADLNQLKLLVKGENFSFYHNQNLVHELSDPDNTFGQDGHIAFDRGRFLGPMVIESVNIESEEEKESKSLWPEISFALPKSLNGFDSAWIVNIKSEQFVGRTVIDAELSGGPVPRKRNEAFSGRLPNEKLTGPYLRLESPDGKYSRKHYLINGSVGLKEHWDKNQCALSEADAECPVGEHLIIDELPENVYLFFGYEKYEAEDRIHMSDAPKEIMLDPRSGKVLYTGGSLEGRKVNLELKSGKDKKICGLIPEDTIDYDDVLAFAENNHYFFDSEACVFTPQITFKTPVFNVDEFNLTVTLEDVFHDKIKDVGVYSLTLKSTETEKSSGLKILASEQIIFDDLGPGVYHLRLELRLGQRLIKDSAHAFEIMSESDNTPAPPIISGLPELYSLHSDYISYTDSFDPWIACNNNAGHYTSGNCYQPIIARERKSWDAVHLFKRKWLIWMAPRTTKNYSVQENRDIIIHGDLIYPFQRIDLWKITSYKDDVLKKLLEFLKENEDQTKDNKDLSFEAIKNCEKITEKTFNELVKGPLLKPWLHFFNEWFVNEFMKNLKNELKSINPNMQIMRYGLYPPYGSKYKSAYFALYTGMDTELEVEKHIEGPVFFEDYPHLCGYPIQRTIYMMSTIKLAAPGLRQYPELYSLCGVPSDSNTVVGSPPYGRFYPPARYFKKRIWEFCYAASWYSNGEFHFWSDRGFQARNFNNEQYDVLIDAWKTYVKIPPVKPLKTAAFVQSREACMGHQDFYDEKAMFSENLWGNLYNTAEECIAFAYEQARVDGQLGGFVINAEDVRDLEVKDVHTLVIPPLNNISFNVIEAIREKHSQGVNLLAFESVKGLEDLFGVIEFPEPVRINHLTLCQDSCLGKALSSEGINLEEETEHPLCKANYALEEAEVLITGRTKDSDEVYPVLTVKENSKAEAVLFTVPPTVVKRSYLKENVSYGNESLSTLMNRATAIVMRNLGDHDVETTEGKLIGFYDAGGDAHIIIEEDALPGTPQEIDPLITINFPNLKEEMISAEIPFSIVDINSESAKIRLHLEENECVMIHVKR